MLKRNQQRGWRLGGKKAPAWLQAPCDPEVKKGVRADFDLLRETFRFDRLAATHPLRHLWEKQGELTKLSEARFEFHHLAHDLRIIRGVDGWQELVKALRTDADNYADYRYELRIAGAVGCSQGQQLVRLGGKKKGADIEVTTKSGHRCGIACYRAKSITPKMQESSWTHEALMKELGAIIVSSPVSARISITIEFPRFPIEEAVGRSSVEAFKKLWANPAVAEMTSEGVTAKRITALPTQSPCNWETRIIFRLPVPACEKQRLADNIRVKLEKEDAQWAGQYSGIPVLAVEESDYSLGVEKDAMAPLLSATARHSFVGLLCTTAFFRNNGKHGRFRMEDPRWLPRDGMGSGMNLGVETFGENLACYGDGYAVVNFNPRYAEEEWLFRLNPATGNVDGNRVRWLSLTRVFDRLPLPAPGNELTAKDFETVIQRILSS